MYAFLITVNGALFDKCDESSGAVTWDFLNS
jgi:hypothetical protein